MLLRDLKLTFEPNNSQLDIFALQSLSESLAQTQLCIYSQAHKAFPAAAVFSLCSTLLLLVSISNVHHESDELYAIGIDYSP